MFNLQSVTVQTNAQGAASATEPSQGLTGGAGAGKPRAAGAGVRVPGVGGAHVNNGFMREMSTELEKKLETRPRDRPITVTSNSQVSKSKKPFPLRTPRPGRGGRQPPRGLLLLQPASPSTLWRRWLRWRRGRTDQASALRGNS